jgi:hypothetical protein
VKWPSAGWPRCHGAHTEPLAAVRCALYMATLSAVRHDRILKEFYPRLRAAGKKPLVAMTACMRKLVILMKTAYSKIMISNLPANTVAFRKLIPW